MTIPDKVKSVDSGAFCQCSSLREVKIGNSITNIGAGAFYQCNSLTNAIIPYGVTRIGGGLCEFVGDATWFVFGAFYGCSSLESVTIPNTVTSIGAHAFHDCNNLRNVYLHDVVNVKGIAAWCGIDFEGDGSQGSSPLRYAQNLYLNGELVTALEIPEGVTGIGNYAFNNCDCLQSVSIPDSVVRVGSGAFSGCNNITSTMVPQSVMDQGLSTTFGGSYQSLQSLRLGANVSAIGVNEFANCRALTSVTVADGNTSYVVLDDGCLYDIARNLILLCPRDKASITIPNGVTAIGNYAFQYCTNLVSASMPETLQSIGSGSFVGCAKLCAGGESGRSRHCVRDGGWRLRH